MAKFRKKPVVIEAYQTTVRHCIDTLEGTLWAQPDDWIITGVQGEQYPCKPDIFAATYDPVDDDETVTWDEFKQGLDALFDKYDSVFRRL